MTVLIYLSLISGFLFPYFLIQAIKREDAFGYTMLSCASFGVIAMTLLLFFT